MSLFEINCFKNLPEAANKAVSPMEISSTKKLEDLVHTISPFMTPEEYRRLYEIARQKGYRHNHHTYNDTFSVRHELFEPNPLIHNAIRDRYIADHDALTGLFSKGALKQELLRRKRLLASQENHPEKDSRFWIFMIDIDLFKTVNDTYGHPAGDSVLRAVARSLHSIMREYDFLARYGGEEFTLLVEGTAPDIFSLAERARSEMEKNPVIIPNQGDEQNLRIPITISIGISYCDENPDATLEEADAALYCVKGKPSLSVQQTYLASAKIIQDNGGRIRNRVCYYDKRENGFIFDPHLS